MFSFLKHYIFYINPCCLCSDPYGLCLHIYSQCSEPFACIKNLLPVSRPPRFVLIPYSLLLNPFFQFKGPSNLYSVLYVQTPKPIRYNMNRFQTFSFFDHFWVALGSSKKKSKIFFFKFKNYF